MSAFSLLLCIGILYCIVVSSSAAVVKRRGEYDLFFFKYDKERPSCTSVNCLLTSDCDSPCNFCCNSQCCVDPNSVVEREGEGRLKLCNEECNSWFDCDQRTCGTCSYGLCIPTPYVTDLSTSHYASLSISPTSKSYYRFQWKKTKPVKQFIVTLNSHQSDGEEERNKRHLNLLAAATGDIATETHYQLINESISSVKTVSVSYPKHIEGEFGWGFTVWNKGDTPLQYTITLTVHYMDPKCPDNCSGHGHCIYNDSKPLCICNDGWGGVACAYVSYDLHADEPVSVTIKDDEFVYFNITTKDPPFNNMTVFVQTFTKDPNAIAPSMYVANGYYPLASQNQYNDSTPNHRKSLTILDPAPGIWYIALYGRNNPSLILTVQVNMDDVCFSRCSLNGKCQPPDPSGYVSCQCSDNFKGEYCEEYTSVMTNSTSYSGYVEQGFWNYWHFNITIDPTDSTYLNLTVTSNDTTIGAPDIYTQLNGHPNSSQFVCHDSSSSPSSPSLPLTSVTCQVKDKTMLGKGNSWYIGVLGNSQGGGWGNYTVSATLYGATGEEWSQKRLL